MTQEGDSSPEFNAEESTERQSQFARIVLEPLLGSHTLESLPAGHSRYAERAGSEKSVDQETGEIQKVTIYASIDGHSPEDRSFEAGYASADENVLVGGTLVAGPNPDRPIDVSLDQVQDFDNELLGRMLEAAEQATHQRVSGLSI